MEPQPTLDRGWFRGRKFSSSGQGAATVAGEENISRLSYKHSRQDGFRFATGVVLGKEPLAVLSFALFVFPVVSQSSSALSCKAC